MDDYLVVGRVAQTHGNRGDVIVNPETDFPDDRFAPGRVLQLEMPGRSEPRRIVSVRFHQGRPVIGLAGVDDDGRRRGACRRGAEDAGGGDCAAAAAGPSISTISSAARCGHEAGRRIGRVTAVDGPMERSRLVVDGPRGEVLIPHGRRDLRERRSGGAAHRGGSARRLLELNDRSASERAEASKPAGLKIDIVTIFPQMVEAPLAEGIVGRAIARGLLDVRVHDLRDFTTDRHRVVDDMPFGGGPGWC